ncbi:MAG: hypothetical protein EBT09_03220, partial [Actinobacteria bacterium]|nr:hypothetical protein [Actinomycetota bacterium]
MQNPSSRVHGTVRSIGAAVTALLAVMAVLGSVSRAGAAPSIAPTARSATSTMTPSLTATIAPTAARAWFDSSAVSVAVGGDVSVRVLIGTGSASNLGAVTAGFVADGATVKVTACNPQVTGSCSISTWGGSRLVVGNAGTVSRGGLVLVTLVIRGVSTGTTTLRMVSLAIADSAQ